MAIATTTALILGGAMVASAGIAASTAHQQAKAAKTAADVADKNQARLLKSAEDQATSQEATVASAVSKARQKALAAATASTGRSGTIMTGSQGVVGQAAGTVKNLIGE